jgi:hypothetical protein
MRGITGRRLPALWALAGGAVLGLIIALPLKGEVPGFVPRITDVTVFKDGHALVMARGKAELMDGWCRTREVPMPLLGAFWTFVAEEKSEVDFVKAGFVDAEESRPCLTFEEIIQANAGKRVIIVEHPKDTDAISHEGVLLGILEHETEREVETSETVPSSYDRWGRYVANQTVREAKEEKVESLASFVMLKTEAGVQLIKRENVRSICLAEEKPVTEHKEKTQVREIGIHVAGKGEKVPEQAEVGMVFIQKGVRWIPDYRIELLPDGKARVSLQGTVINDLADMENVDLRLVVGVPSFVMKDALSPMALRDIGVRLSSYFAPPSWRRGETRADYLSNALMSQVALPSRAEGAPASEGGPDVPGEGQREDLFVYHKTGITLRKGERAVVKLLEVTVPYEDIYSWEIPPVPPSELWRNLGTDQIRQLATLLGKAKAMHEIRLTNTGNAPWTTGPATVFKDGTPLGQQVLTYTSVKNRVDVPVTVATDLNTKKEEVEISRTPNIVINADSYTKVALHGVLTVKNFKDKPVHVYVTRKALGTATAATEDGKITRSNAVEDTSISAEENPWFWWNWPWWYYSVNPISEITWDTVMRPGDSATFEYEWYFYCR